jgi:hypothetical protein
VFSVLDVGDGACSVLRLKSIAVIDCGSNDLGADAACDQLMAAIGDHPEVITTIVVTHFDTDHYAGFLRLAERMSARGIRFGQLRLIAPRPPDVEADYTAAYLALAMFVTGLRNLDLADALRKVTVHGGFSYIAVSRAQHSLFSAAGFDFRVHWPPTTLPSRVAGNVRTAMRLYASLSEKLRARNNSVLDDNLELSRGAEWLSRDHESVDGALDSTNQARDFGEPEEFEYVSNELEEGPDYPEIEALQLPDDPKGEFRRAWDAFRRANNNMSIIFDDVYRGGLVVFGDASPSVLRWVAGQGELGPHYYVMVAPHHGTQPLPKNFRVKAEVCISQNGARRGHLWYRHVDTHGSPSSCITTRSGSHHIFL